MKNALCIFIVGLVAIAGMALGVDDSPSTQAVAPASATTTPPWPATSAAAHRIKLSGVPNFGKLNDVLWRSGQPGREGYQSLAAQGLKTVVNLREEFPQDKALIPQGVNYFFIPIQDEAAPSGDQAKKFLELASNPDNWPLLVHCLGGEGRVGVMSAIVRHSLDAWDHEKIMREVGNFRTKHLGFITTPMAGSQRRFIQNWEETASETPKNSLVTEP